MSRRRFLGMSTGAAAAAALYLMPPNVRRALAQSPARRGRLSDIKHVVMLMQENRSFDHYFGTLAGVRGFDDPRVLIQPDGKSIFHQTDARSPHGYRLPFHLDTSKSSAQSIPSNSHTWDALHACWSNGRMDQWMSAHRAADRWLSIHQPASPAAADYVMGYYNREDIPFHFALADLFTVCDAYHCSLLGPTWPNRAYWMTGTVDPEGKSGGPFISDTAVSGGYRWTTYPERLERAGVSWKVYQPRDLGGLSDLNVLQLFHTYQAAGQGSRLYQQGLSPLGSFEQDALNDRLPAVSWIIPEMENSEHPAMLPAAGAAFIANKLNAIAAHPEVWAKTVFILCYDENDGLFDHVPPPVAPAGTPAEFVNGVPIGAGFRVPCMIISPWTTGGWVCSDLFDHTSVLQFLEKWTGVVEPNISDWRRATFGDLTSAFHFAEATAKAPLLPDAEQGLRLALHEVATSPPPTVTFAEQKLPVQEAGTRKHIPLPE